MVQTTSNSANPLTGSLDEDAVQLLVSGLQSLEGALNALQQPLPEGLGELKEILFLQKQLLAKSPAAPLTTDQASLVIGCSSRRVRQLGEQGHIKLVRRGRRGRGHANLYDAASVYTYLDRDRHAADNT